MLGSMLELAPIPAAPDIEIVVPVYNEAAGLEHSIRRLHRFLSDGFPFSWRIVIADNASVDATPEIARRLAVHAARASATCASSRKGRGRALRAAWAASEARVVTYMDVDLSTDLRGLLPLVAPLLSGHSDLAIGTRLAHGSRVVRGPKREFISRAYNRLLHTVLRARFSDAQCGFKAVRRDALENLLGRRQGRRLVLRHRAARARPAARAADPRGAGGLGRRPRLARATSSAPRSPTSRASRGCSPPGPSRASWASACSARWPTRCCSSLLRPLLGAGRRERHGAGDHRGRQHGRQPPAHVRRPRARRGGPPPRARRRSCSCSRSRSRTARSPSLHGLDPARRGSSSRCSSPPR